MKEIILNLPRESKIEILKDALKKEKFGIFFELSKILMDAPLNKGGLESEVIVKIHNENLKWT